MAALLNYTTSVPAERTVAEIEKLLAQHGALQVLKDYENSNVSAISFRIPTDRGVLPFRLPANVHMAVAAINEVIDNWKPKRYGQSRPIPKNRRNDVEHATRVAWRIIKDWLEAQLAIIQMKQAKIEQVFLPYMVNQDGETLYEKLSQTHFKGYLLENKEGEN